MSKPLVITSQSDLRHMRQASHAADLLDEALTGLEEAIQTTHLIRVSRDWHRIGMWMFAVIALVEAIALFGWVIKL